MKKLLIVLLVLIPTFAYAGTWCKWSGSAGFGCRSTIQPTITVNGNEINVDAETLNPLGWYQLTTTHPNLTTNQVYDEEVWDLTGNQMGRTWTVRSMTQTEIDQRDADAMDRTMFFLIQGLIANGTFTLQQAAAWFPQESIDAYQARSRLENP